MIILDTCTIRSIGLNNNSADLLRAIKESEAERVGVPWVVMEELAGQKAAAYLEAWKAAILALEKFAKASPWEVPAVGAGDANGVREYWRQRYGELVSVIPTSQTAFQEAMIREANVLAPCQLKGTASKPLKVGGRDAAIWLTAVEYTREHPDEIVYFVSGNSKDFGDGESGYEHPMDQDLYGIEDRFVHLTKLDDLMGRFAQSTDVNEDLVAAACDRPGTDQVVVGEAARRWDMLFDIHAPGFECTWASDEGSHTGWAGGWLDPGGIKACRTSLTDVHAYRIGKHVWATANVGWELSGFTLLTEEDAFVHAVTHLETHLLLSLTDTKSALTVLRTKKPRAVDHELEEPRQLVDFERMKAALSNLESHTAPVYSSLEQLMRDASKHPSMRSRLFRALNDQRAESRGSNWSPTLIAEDETR
ncbi:PIN domain-containing protein [Streptomyces sp. NPDC006733]|uniref:PIN domain-containing protein n=1 Tax=Streptomyces sp. NPDC006733 TaxID=3155460 RepID=UPI0033C59574